MAALPRLPVRPFLREAPAGSDALAVVVGNFNGDSHADLAVASNDDNNVMILLGNGGGGFVQAAGSPVSAGHGPISLAVGNFNGDGHADLAVANTLSSNVTILLGNGSGGFTQTAGSPVPAGGDPTQIVVGNFNGDSHDDLAIANYGGHNVAILLASGSGGFTPATGSPIFVGFPPPVAVVVGNLNSDSHADFAVTYGSPGSLGIFLGNGSGGFSQAPGSPISVEYASRGLAAGDFNGDNHTDIAVPSSSSDYMTILLGNGSAGFSPAAESPVLTGDVPLAVAVGNFDGDSYDDLAVADHDSDDVTILLGGCPVADLGVSVTDSSVPSVPGGTIIYTISVQNLGPDPATIVAVSDTLSPSTTFASLTAPSGWSCTTPGNGATGTVTCTIPYLPVGVSAFTVGVHVGAGVAAPSTVTNTASVNAATGESAGGNNVSSVNTSIVAATPTLTPTQTPTSMIALTPTLTVTPGGMPASTATATATPSPTAPPTPTPTPSPTPFASAPKDEKEDEQKETEQQRLQREHTNRSGLDDVATEGNVLAVDLTANPPTISIANRDGIVTLVWVGPLDQLPHVGPGDYIQVDGQKVTEQLYEITDLSVD